MATMSSPYRTQRLADSDRRVRSPLQKLRGTIRFYAVAEALSVLIVCLAVWFWIGLALDYGTFRISGLDWIEHMPLWLRAAGLGAVLLGIIGFVEFRLHRKVFRKPQETVESVSGMPVAPSLMPSMMVTNYIPERRKKKPSSVMFGILGVFIWLAVAFAYFVVASFMQDLFWTMIVLTPVAVLAAVLYGTVRYLSRPDAKLADFLFELAVGSQFFLTPLLALFFFGTRVFPVVLLLGFTAGTLRVAFNLRWWAVALVMVLLAIYFGIWGGFGVLLSWFPANWPRWFVATALVTVILGGLAAFMVLKRLFYDFSDPALALVLERKFPKLLGDRLITAVELSDVHAAAKLGYSGEMIEETINEAAERVDKVPVKEVFNWTPLVLRTVLAVFLAVGMYALVAGGFCAAPTLTGGQASLAGLGQFHDVSDIWAERNLMLENTGWPRRAYLEVIGWPDNPERQLRVGQTAAPPTVRVRALKWVWSDDRDHWRALTWGDLAEKELIERSVPLPKSMTDQRPEWTVDQVELQLARLDAAGRADNPELLPYRTVREVLDKLELFTQIPGVTVRKQKPAEAGPKDGERWVVGDGDAQKPLTWDDLKTFAPQLKADVKVTVPDLPAGWPREVDEVIKKLGQARLEELDFLKEASGAMEKLNAIVAAGEMKRQLRKLTIPEKVVVFTRGDKTRAEMMLEKQGENEYTGTFSDLKESIKFQANGEDYYTPWFSIELVPPPAVTELLVDEWRPAYLYYRVPEGKTADDLKTQKQVFYNRQISVSGGDTSRFEVPAGTDVTLKGTMDKPLKRPASNNGQEPGIRLLPPRKGTTEVKAEVSQPDDKTWHLSIKNIRAVQDFVLEFKDPDNVVSLRHIIIRPLEDLPPDVDTVVDSVIRKTAQGYLVTAKAFVPFVGKVRDDHGLEKVQFAYNLTKLEGAAEGGGRALAVLSALYQSAGPLGSRLTSSLQLAGSARAARPDAGGDDKLAQRQPMFGFDRRFAGRSDWEKLSFDQVRQLLNLDGNQNLPGGQPWNGQPHPAATSGRLLREFPLDANDPTDKPEAINNHDGFDLEPFKIAVASVDVQPRYRLQLWLEIEDNAIDPQPHKSLSKERFIFQVVGESDLLSEVAKEEESLQLRMEELIRKLEDGRTRLDKLKIDIGPVGSRDLKDEEFLGIDERLKASEEGLEKSLDMSVNLIGDYQRIVRELRVNRTNPGKIARTLSTIVAPLEQLLRSDWEDKNNPMADAELEPQHGHFAWALDGLHKGREAMSPVLTRLQEMRAVENRPKFSDDARDRFTKARDRLDKLILRLRGVLSAMEGITDLNRAIEKARKIKEDVELQGGLLELAFKAEQERVLRELNLFDVPPKKP